jgi:UDP-galactopyranose mutase
LEVSVHIADSNPGIPDQKKQPGTTMNYEYLVVGAGLFGSVMAERLANDAGARVLVIDKRGHIGGNCHSQRDPDTGIEFHTYGTHIFHTSSREVWEYVGRFTEFNGYHHQVLATHRGTVYQLPVNLATINAFYGLQLNPAEARAFLSKEIEKEEVASPRNLEEKAVSLIGRPLYEAFIRGYTVKQWGRDPRELPPDIFSRLPVRYNYDSNYFVGGRWQGIPLEGYTRMFERLLDSPRIDVRLDCDYFRNRDEFGNVRRTIYSGPLDRFFDFIHGRLEWRSNGYRLDTVPVEDFQGTSVMNYVDAEIAFTRIHEPRHLHPERCYRQDCSLLFYETPMEGNDEPYYPVNTPDSHRIFEKYLALAGAEKNVIIGGRLGSYRYLDMDETILAALKCYRDNF